MKKLVQVRNRIIIVLCITIICMGIGFIILSMAFKKEKESISSFDVVFSDVQTIAFVKGSDIEPSGKIEVIEGGRELDMTFTLNSVHDEASSVVTIRNNGTLPAEIVDVFTSPDYSIETYQKLISPVTLTFSDLKGKIIPPGEEMELKVVAYYAPNSITDAKKVVRCKVGLITKSR